MYRPLTKNIDIAFTAKMGFHLLCVFLFGFLSIPCFVCSDISQVPHPRIQVRPAGPIGGGRPEAPLHHGQRALRRQGGNRWPPPGANGGRPHKAAESSAAASNQRDTADLHQPRNELSVWTGGAERKLPGPSLFQHPGRGRDPGDSQKQKPLQLLRLD